MYIYIYWSFFNWLSFSLFSFQPVLHDWCNKGCDMCYQLCHNNPYCKFVLEALVIVFLSPNTITTVNSIHVQKPISFLCWGVVKHSFLHSFACRQRAAEGADHKDHPIADLFCAGVSLNIHSFIPSLADNEQLKEQITRITQ